MQEDVTRIIERGITMIDFKDFDLDLSQSASVSSTEKSIISTVITWYTENYCSDPSTHCSPSDMTQCRNIADPGKAARC